MTTRVRVLREDDFEGFKKFLIQHYYGHEPLLQTPGDHNRYPITSEKWKERVHIIREGLSLAAFDENDCIVGVAFAKVMQPKELEKNWLEVKKQKPSDLLSHIYYFLSKLKRESRVFQRYNATQALYLYILAVDRRFIGQGLGRRLVDGLITLARSKGLTLLFTTCTGIYSQRVMATQGLEVVLSESYANYKDEDGNEPLRPPSPHREASVMAIELQKGGCRL